MVTFFIYIVTKAKLLISIFRGESRIFMGAGGRRKKLCARMHITSAKPRVPYVWGRGSGPA